MKLLRDTLGTTGRYLDLMRINAPLRIQGPGYRGLVDRLPADFVPMPPGPRVPRQFYRWREYKTNPMHFQCVGGSGFKSASGSRHVQHIEYRQHIDSHYNHPFVPVRYLDMVGSLVPFRHTYNASRII